MIGGKHLPGFGCFNSGLGGTRVIVDSHKCGELEGCEASIFCVGRDLVRSCRRLFAYGGPSLLRFSRGIVVCGATRIAVARRSGNDIGCRDLGIQGLGGSGFAQCLEDIWREIGGIWSRSAIFNHPARQHRFRSLGDPLIDQGADFTAEIGRMVETGELETFQ